MTLTLIICLIAVVIPRCTDTNSTPKEPITQNTINWSISKYNEELGRNYEEVQGYKAIFCTIDEITTEKIREWIDLCDFSEGYYQYTHSDPASWEILIYYPKEANVNYDKLKFYIEESPEKSVVFYVESSDMGESKNSQEYLLILLQAPYRGVWPRLSRLFIDGHEINLENEAWTP